MSSNNIYGPKNMLPDVETVDLEEVLKKISEAPHPVQKPAHYNQGDIECIDAIASCLGESTVGYYHGNALKYLWRHRYKGKPREDLEKAIFYINKLLEEYDDQ